jgi:hypothetical protein
MITAFAHSAIGYVNAHANQIGFGALALFCIALCVDVARTKSNPYQDR